MSIWVCTGCNKLIHSSSTHFYNSCGKLEFWNPQFVENIGITTTSAEPPKMSPSKQAPVKKRKK